MKGTQSKSSLLLAVPLALLCGAADQCTTGPFDECLVEVGTSLLANDGVAEDATLMLAQDGTVLASFITGELRTETEIRRLDGDTWESHTIANSSLNPARWEANFHNIVQRPSGQFHLIGAFASQDNFLDGDGRIYALDSVPAADGTYSWDSWPDLTQAQAITNDDGFDFGAVAATDSLGRIWVVFISDRPTPGGATDNLWITHHSDGEGWHEPVAITASVKRDSFPQLNFDKNRRLNLTWVRMNGDRAALLEGIGQEQEIVVMTSAVDEDFSGTEWGAEQRLVLSNESSVNTLATVFEGPLDSHVAWISKDFADPASTGFTPVRGVQSGLLAQMPNDEQLSRTLRLPGERYMHAWTHGFGNGPTSIRYRIHDCSAVTSP